MEIYDSIDTLPIWNYWQCINKKSLDFLVINASKSTPAETLKAALVKAWNKIEDEMIALQLRDPKYVAGLRNEGIHFIRQAKAAISGSALDKLHFKISEDSRNETLEKEFNYNDSIAMLEERLGWNINDRKMTVSRYYTHIQRLKNGRGKN